MMVIIDIRHPLRGTPTLVTMPRSFRFRDGNPGPNERQTYKLLYTMLTDLEYHPEAHPSHRASLLRAAAVRSEVPTSRLPPTKSRRVARTWLPGSTARAGEPCNDAEEKDRQ